MPTPTFSSYSEWRVSSAAKSAASACETRCFGRYRFNIVLKNAVASFRLANERVAKTTGFPLGIARIYFPDFAPRQKPAFTAGSSTRRPNVVAVASHYNLADLGKAVLPHRLAANLGGLQ